MELMEWQLWEMLAEEMGNIFGGELAKVDVLQAVIGKDLFQFLISQGRLHSNDILAVINFLMLNLTAIHIIKIHHQQAPPLHHIFQIALPAPINAFFPEILFWNRMQVAKK